MRKEIINCDVCELMIENGEVYTLVMNDFNGQETYEFNPISMSTALPPRPSLHKELCRECAEKVITFLYIAKEGGLENN